MSDIRDTVLSSMKANGLGGYEGQAGPVIRALETREAEIVDNLVSFATENGLSRDQAYRALVDCGLSAPLAAVTAAPEEDPRIAAMEATMAEMQATLRALRGE
jgi:hypothetical protein